MNPFVREVRCALRSDSSSGMGSGVVFDGTMNDGRGFGSRAWRGGQTSRSGLGVGERAKHVNPLALIDAHVMRTDCCTCVCARDIARFVFGPLPEAKVQLAG